MDVLLSQTRQPSNYLTTLYVGVCTSEQNLGR